MRRLLLIILIGICVPAFSQDPDIVALEYYIDNDPGYGAGTPISFAQGSSIDINITIPTGALSNGYHILGIRGRDENGVWGFHEVRVFLVQPTGSVMTHTPADVQEFEYFFDDDPGHGSATPINSFTPAGTIDINELISSAALSNGMHTLTVRALDDNGEWGMKETRTILVAPPGSVVNPPAEDVQALEFFIDTDPGVGNATPITSFGAGLTIDINELISTGALSDGLHVLTVRAQDALGRWGMGETRAFLIQQSGTVSSPSPSPIEELEYFFDNDPGTGSAVSISSFGPATTIDINELLPQGLSEGVHTLHIRARAQDGDWGMWETRPFKVDSDAFTTPVASEITQVEYFFNDDPGAGNATDFPITPAVQIDDSTSVATPMSIPVGTNSITVRARNALGIWGPGELREFDVIDNCLFPDADFSVQLACAGQTINFIDNSTDIQPDATYRWYFDGDNIPDDTNVGNSSYTYPNAGIYTASLAIYQGTVCSDSVAMTFEIRPQPVVLFTPIGTEAGSPTLFQVASANVPPDAIWSWDFEGDAVIDDNTQGSATHIYPSAGSYMPSVSVIDPFGCGTIYSARVTIDPEGGGGGSGGTPLADFTSNIVCEGQATPILDLSQNIPGGSTYSWDFDNDGVEDDNTPGNTVFDFGAPGTYPVTLTIDTGGPVLTAIRNVEVYPVPIADFTTMDVCDGTTVDFTDMTTGTLPSVSYEWDFDGDGVVDDNTVGNTSFTYTASGIYTVLLLVNNGNGCFATVTRQLEVFPQPQPDFQYSSACVGQVMTFTDLSQEVLPGAVYSWDFDGDGTEDSNVKVNPTFSYPSPGDYDVSLTIDNGQGCVNNYTETVTISEIPVVDFEVQARCFGQESFFIDNSTNISPAATYAWDFDNDGSIDDTTVGGTTFTYPSFSSYVATLTIDNGGGCSATYEVLVVFRDAALPDFSTGLTCAGQETVFTDLSTQLETGSTYSWDFNGDGLEDSQFPGSTAYTFNAPGEYPATLTIDNGNNCLAFQTINVQVTAPPDIDLGEDVLLCQEGTVTIDAGTGYSTYFWPDGSTDQTYTVDQIGEYPVVVTDALGCRNSDTVSVRLQGPPEPGFDYQIEFTNEGIWVHFNNTSSNADIYSWDFGDGGTSDEDSPSHLYTDFSFYSTSLYDICLTGFNNCEDSLVCEQILLSPTGGQGLDKSGVSVFPNPVTELLNIMLPTGHENGEITLLDMQGVIMFERKVDSSEKLLNIDVSGYARGMYTLMIGLDEVVTTRKIIVQ